MPTHPHDRSTDQIFEGITWGKITKVAGAIMAVGTILITTMTFGLSQIVTRRQLDDVSKRFADTVSVYERRLSNLETNVSLINKTLNASVALQGSMATVQCFTLERDRSSYYARAAKLPCDTLIGSR